MADEDRKFAPLPPSGRTKRNEPEWVIPFNITIKRMDHSLCMYTEAATFSNVETGEVVGTLNAPLGGIGLVYMAKGDNDPAPGFNGGYAFDFSEAIKTFVEEILPRLQAEIIKPPPKD